MREFKSSLRRRLKIPLMRNGCRVIANERLKMPNEIHSYSELQQQIHDDLRVQHPEWIEPKWKLPNLRFVRVATRAVTSSQSAIQ